MQSTNSASVTCATFSSLPPHRAGSDQITAWRIWVSSHRGMPPPEGSARSSQPWKACPTFVFNNFLVGVPEVTTRQYNNSFQWLDNFSKVIGRHSLKFGGQFHYDQINERNFAAENGQYGFTGNETGIDFADFLIGAPDSLTQASPQILDSRSKYYGLFAQDSWRATSNLVFNYGLRWEASMPWYDTQNKIETIIPGKQSVKFPGRAVGLCGCRRSRCSSNPGAHPVAQLFASPRFRIFPRRKNQYSSRLRSVLHLGGRSLAIPRSRRSALRTLLRQRQPAAARGPLSDPFHADQRGTALSVPISSDQRFAAESRHDFPLGASRAALLRLLFRSPKTSCLIPSTTSSPSSASLGRTLCSPPAMWETRATGWLRPSRPIPPTRPRVCS